MSYARHCDDPENWEEQWERDIDRAELLRDAMRDDAAIEDANRWPRGSIAIADRKLDEMKDDDC